VPRYKLTLEYNGAGFAGWQIQPDERTVQGELQLRLGWLCGPETRVTGAGRTDAGVHALGQVAHFDADPIASSPDFLDRLNSALPHDIAALRLDEVNADFHARYSARRKTYRYRIACAPTAFATGFAWRVHGKIDWSAVVEATTFLSGRHDFAGFCLAASQKEDTSCRIMAAEWTRNDRESVFEITGDRFLHRMVRLAVGTLIDIGRGRWSPDHIRNILTSSDVRLAGQAAPPDGLYLVSVDYA
jgi:tRNA pseudouridine38-40 synthase